METGKSVIINYFAAHKNYSLFLPLHKFNIIFAYHELNYNQN